MTGQQGRASDGGDIRPFLEAFENHRGALRSTALAGGSARPLETDRELKEAVDGLIIAEAACFLDEVGDHLDRIEGKRRADEERARQERDRRRVENEERARRLHPEWGAAVQSSTRAMRAWEDAISSMSQLFDFMHEARRRRRAARLRSRLVHPALTAVFSLVVGVVVVEVISEELEAANVWVAWAFILSAWALLDHVVEPWLRRWFARRYLKALSDELEYTQNSLMQLRSETAGEEELAVMWAALSRSIGAV